MSPGARWLYRTTATQNAAEMVGRLILLVALLTLLLLLFIYVFFMVKLFCTVSLPSQAHHCVLLPHYCPMGCLADYVLVGRAQERDKEVFRVQGTRQMKSPWQWKCAVSSCLQVAGILAAVHKQSVCALCFLLCPHHQTSCSMRQRGVKPG